MNLGHNQGRHRPSSRRVRPRDGHANRHDLRCQRSSDHALGSASNFRAMIRAEKDSPRATHRSADVGSANADAPPPMQGGTGRPETTAATDARRRCGRGLTDSPTEVALMKRSRSVAEPLKRHSMVRSSAEPAAPVGNTSRATPFRPEVGAHAVDAGGPATPWLSCRRCHFDLPVIRSFPGGLCRK